MQKVPGAGHALGRRGGRLNWGVQSLHLRVGGTDVSRINTVRRLMNLHPPSPTPTTLYIPSLSLSRTSQYSSPPPSPPPLLLSLSLLSWLMDFLLFGFHVKQEIFQSQLTSQTRKS